MQSVFPEARAAGRTLRVPVGPLHTFLAVDDLAPPVLLKLDVQGFELEALKGCERLLAAIDHLYVECSYLELYVGQALFADIDGYLRRHGFTNAAEINRVERAGIGRVQSDCLFAAARAAGGVPA
jgi:hypothetical protein